eukprot:CAMPEP_0115252934 /NCGR_PEP_ID=MMETSP0270-20121206/44407_1 /TAXON_ID=71861 /ORGANISM="Scrippsiella trochoidea, Strain CCMP3099" /LENGTH=130 /DNA_ID=CAMNT_0002668413 /DNA_START=205 /DNA_END=597 /DNA_ORIENTATION=-
MMQLHLLRGMGDSLVSSSLGATFMWDSSLTQYCLGFKHSLTNNAQVWMCDGFNVLEADGTIRIDLGQAQMHVISLVAPCELHAKFALPAATVRCRSGASRGTTRAASPRARSWPCQHRDYIQHLNSDLDL